MGNEDGRIHPPYDQFTGHLASDVAAIKAVIGHNDDLLMRPLEVGQIGVNGVLIYFEGCVDYAALGSLVISKLLHNQGPLPRGDARAKALRNRVLSLPGVSVTNQLTHAIEQVLYGKVLFLLDGMAEALLLTADGWPKRSIQEPFSEPSVRGPRDGFTETLEDNTALIRRRTRDPNLQIERYTIGRRGQNRLALIWVRDVTSTEMVEEARNRLKAIDVDQIVDAGQLEQLIEDSWLSPFPQTMATERPDKVVAALTQGRIAFLLDGSPFAILVPAGLASFLQASEDHYERWHVATLLRTLRLGAALIATFLPSIYVAIITYHPGMIPSRLVLTVAASRDAIPFPAFMEVILMELTVEILREAGARLPKTVGQTVSVVGGLVIGDAAVRASLVSPVLVVLVGLTAIASFMIPSYSAAVALRILRFPIMVAAAVFGLYGIVLSFIVLVIHLVTLRSFGTVYLAPLAPYRFGDWKDAVLRSPSRMLAERPTSYHSKDKVRMDTQTDNAGGGKP